MAGSIAAEGFQHVALLYDGEGHYLSEIPAFITAALSRDEPVMVAVPPGRAGALRAALGADARRVAFTDIAKIGGNPARIIPAVTAFAESQGGGRINWVGECTWPERPVPEVLEVATHESLTNLAFANLPVTALCPYDATESPTGLLAMIQQTHPLLAHPAALEPSLTYLGPHRMPPPCVEPLPSPPPTAKTCHYHTGLRQVRQMTRRAATTAGLPRERTTDLVIAISELAANTLRHSRGGGTLRIWQAPGELVCEVSDQGWITDPLAGRRPPIPDHPGGDGLWVVNQLCDLVERRTSPAGTINRVHMKLNAHSSSTSSG